MRDGGLAARLDEWRIVLARQAVLARQVMQKQVVHQLRLTREVRDEGRFYGWTGQAP